MKQQEINICFACNDKYFPHMLVAITSILDNLKKDRELQIHILTRGISRRNARILYNIKKNNNNLKYNIVLISDKDFANCPITGYVKYITKETYYRFKIPSLLRNIDKVLYLDCDIVVLDDISKLYDYSFADGKHIGMVPDTHINYHKNRLGLGKKSHYCNAGVMLIDNKFLREINAESTLFNFTKSPDREITFQDQDVINIVLEKYIELLPISWNLTHDALLKVDSYEGELKDSLRKAKQKPSIVHFTNPIKPWNFACKNPYTNEYLHYLKKLPFKSKTLKLYIFKIIGNVKRFIFHKENNGYVKEIKIFGIKIIKKTNRSQQILDYLKNLDKKIWWIHECTKSIFQYQTGLEFDDDCRPERMIVYDYNKAPKDHKERYDFALNIVSKDDNVLDAACGVGYGSYALSFRSKSVLGIDINANAIAFANNIFKSQNLSFEVADLLTLSSEKYKLFDKIISFETVEHVPNADVLLKVFRTLLKDNGKLIFSVPNQNKVPFSEETHPFHEKHFTVDELKKLLQANGFTNIKVYFQYDELNHKITDNYNKSEGENIIIEAEAL